MSDELWTIVDSFIDHPSLNQSSFIDHSVIYESAPVHTPTLICEPMRRVAVARVVVRAA